MNNTFSHSPTIAASIVSLISQYEDAYEKYRKTANSDASEAEINKAFDVAETFELSILRHECASMSDIRQKVRFVLENENALDSIQNCTLNGESILLIYLRSLIARCDT